MDSGFHGVIVPLLTPVDESEQVKDLELKRLVDYVIGGGVDAIFAMGTTGEFARFDEETRGRVIASVVRHTAGRVPVYAGVSDCGTKRVLSNIKRAEDAGASAVVATLPYYFPNTSKGEAVQFFSDVAASTKLPVILYNIPVAIGSAIGRDVLDELYPIENIAGIKDSSGDLKYLEELLRRYHGKSKPFAVIVGDESAAYSGLSMGADGMVPSLANPYPRLLKAIYDSALLKNDERLRYYCGIMNDMNRLNTASDCWMFPNIWRKVALEMMGIINACFTKPYLPADDAARAGIAQTVTQYQALFPDA